ncbi:branched-chain amino acid ABC transporter substrate-binding protein [Paraburkholderia flagellata]|uniref:branched-chain amino acid ABC transporter substrate-binding protein n=1 Tax=Paraburkholderia flagellata TaxID=2883241 RepID=UPI003570E389
MKMHKSLRLVMGTSLLGLCLGTARAQEVVTVGAANPLTGSLAAMGKDAENGARLAVEEINASGLTIGGRPVTLKLEGKDDAADPRTATTVAQSLVDDNIVAIIGHLNSGASIPASKIYSGSGIVQISTATNPAYTQQGFKTTFRAMATDAQQGPALASYAVDTLHAKRVAVVDDATTYGQGLADQFSQAVKAKGVEVVSRDATNDHTIDYRAILTRIKGEKPDVIMFGGADAGAGPFVKQAQQLGIVAQIVGGDGICTEKLAELAGPASRNVVCSEAGAALDKMPGGPAFKVRYEKRYGQPIQAYAPYNYDAVYVVVDAMKRANSIDKAKILAAMPSTDYKGVTGEIAYEPNGDLKHGVISIFTYVNGKQKLLIEMQPQ